MLKIAFLFVGADAFRARWYVLPVLGAVLLVLASLLALDASDGVTLVTKEAMGAVFILNGLLALYVFVALPREGSRYLSFLKATALIVLGSLILDFPLETRITIAWLFGFAFAVDGVGRIATATVLRFPGWQVLAACGVVELLLALLIVTEWPLSHNQNIPFCIALLLGLWGWLLVRFGLMLRSLEDEASAMNLPIFAGRGWYQNAPVLIGGPGREAVEHPMIVHVWTPVGSAYQPERRLLVDRYIAAVDGNGVISTGHAALEMQPNLYISHYPAQEIDRSSSDFAASLRATAENDLRGRFQPSYDYESKEWCPADQNVEFHNFDPRRLRAFWAGYRQDDTYNLTNRNCSVVVAEALDAALEGSLASRYPWVRLLRLLANPDLWTAALIRSHAYSMTWTPGLVLDYARILVRLTQAEQTSWSSRFGRFVRRLRPGSPTAAPQSPAA
ncbi:protease [Ancylobacter sonchi]|uniref:HdeD family acid-resistance protein n=1 Tax=Ancylobacter sonchi TaxID=1937790 RepID=UPI001BD4563B|nr:protease [Ancylobacter sonchi]MBS7534930.1 protease [Ancylobacter sonchi]